MQNDIAMGNLNYQREDLDWYPTPEWVTGVLLRNLEIPKGYVIWEPACGLGHMAVPLMKKYGNIIATDIVNRGWEYQFETHDFLKDKTVLENFKLAIITNPPYGKITDQFIQRALDITEPQKGMVAMLMRNEFDCAASRRKFFADHPAFTKKIVLLKRPRWYEYKPGDAGPRHNYAWYIWDCKNTSPPTVWYDK